MFMVTVYYFELMLSHSTENVPRPADVSYIESANLDVLWSRQADRSITDPTHLSSSTEVIV